MSTLFICWGTVDGRLPHRVALATERMFGPLVGDVVGYWPWSIDGTINAESPDQIVVVAGRPSAHDIGQISTPEQPYRLLTHGTSRDLAGR